jgi:hypothetical protein
LIDVFRKELQASHDFANLIDALIERVSVLASNVKGAHTGSSRTSRIIICILSKNGYYEGRDYGLSVRIKGYPHNSPDGTRFVVVNAAGGAARVVPPGARIGVFAR